MHYKLGHKIRHMGILIEQLQEASYPVLWSESLGHVSIGHMGFPSRPTRTEHIRSG